MKDKDKGLGHNQTISNLIGSCLLKETAVCVHLKVAVLHYGMYLMCDLKLRTGSSFVPLKDGSY